MAAGPQKWQNDRTGAQRIHTYARPFCLRCVHFIETFPTPVYLFAGLCIRNARTVCNKIIYNGF